MNISDLHEFIALLENHQQVAFHSPEEIDNCIHRASMDLFWKFAPVYGDNKEAKTALDPFQQTYQVTPANSPLGLVTLPQGLAFPSVLNFATLLSCMAVSYDNTRLQTVYFDIDMVNNDELAQRLMSQIKPVTRDRPIATSNGNGVYQLYPQQPNTAMFTYLALPVKPVYGYTIVGRKPQYNAGASTQLQWNEAYFTEIINGSLVYLGLNLGDTNLVQFMAQKSAS